MDKPEYLYGKHAALEALRSGREIRRLLVAATAQAASVAELSELARSRGVPISSVDRRRLDVLAEGHNHQGVLAEAAPFAYAGLDDLLAGPTSAGRSPLLLALDSLQDPQNFGTLLRTALAAGVDGVVIAEHRAVGITPAVARASAGAVEYLPVARVANVTRSLRSLKERGVWVYGLAAGAGLPFWEVDWRLSSVVVVGSEGHGLGRLVRETCDVMVHVPMAPGSLESLNAAVAGSLVLYEAFRQRTMPPATGPQASATGSRRAGSSSTT